MPPLLSEDAVNQSELEATSLEPKGERTFKSDDVIERAIDDLRRDMSEIKSQVFPLRIDISRLSFDLKKVIVITGIAVVLVIMFVVAGSHLDEPSSQEGVNASNNTTGGSLATLNADIEILRTTMRNLTERINSQTVDASNTLKPATSLDCKKIPDNIKTVTVDFSIQFPLGSASISTADEVKLDSIAKILALAPDRCIIIEGYTDVSGKENKNMTLSKERANAVANYIAGKANISRDHLVPVGKGSSSPLGDEDPRAPQNRRVVIKVVSG